MLVDVMTIKFTVNFAAIIILACAIDSQTGTISKHLSEGDDIDPESVANGIRFVNNMFVASVAAINSYAFIVQKSERILDIVAVAYLIDLAAILYLKNKWRRKPDSN